MELAEEVARHFSKKYEFHKPDGGWQMIPDVSFWLADEWEEPSLLQLKSELNAVKNLLNDKDRVKWCNHTQFTNPAGNIVHQLRRRIHPELCTQAWAKFYEILSNFQELTVVPGHIGLKSVHLCEAPGAFIAALNHFLSLHYCQQKRKWQWIGTTLNPYYEGNSRTCMVTDDRFILNTSEHWEFGADNTGDIMNLKNMDYLCGAVNALGPVHFVSADGSINCSADPAEQESTVGWLHYCEVVTAFHILASGGNFVIKMFTFFEHLAISLMYLLNFSFSKVTIFKPGTSKAGNSEVYIVCLDYNKTKVSCHLTQLKKVLDGPMPQKALLDMKLIPVEFIEQLNHCCLFFKTHQIQIIQRNIELFDDFNIFKRHYVDQLKSSCVDYYFEECGVKRIPESQCIMPKAASKKPTTSAKDLVRYIQQGSFNDWKQQEHLPLANKLDFLEQELNTLLPDSWNPQQYPEQMILNDTFDDYSWVQKSKLVWGKPITAVHSTRFCYQYIWNLWNDVKNHCTDLKDRWLKEDLSSFITECSGQMSTNAWIANICSLHEDLTSFEEHFQVLQHRIEQDLSSSSFEKTLWIQTLIHIVKTLPHNDNLLIIAGDIATRFQAGCFFILTQFFSQITVVRPFSVPPLDPRVVIMCRQFRQPQALVVSFLEQVHLALTKESVTSALLEILPVPFLVDTDCYSCLYKFNEAKLGHQIHTIIATEKEKLSR